MLRVSKFVFSLIACLTLVACQSQPRQANNPIVAAVAKNETKIVTQYLAEGGDPNAKNRTGDPLLFVATVARGGGHDVARLLIKAGADVNGQSSRGRTVLASAASWCDIDMVRLLIEAGAQVNSAGNDDALPLDTVCKSPADKRNAVIALLRAAGG